MNRVQKYDEDGFFLNAALIIRCHGISNILKGTQIERINPTI